MNRLDPALKRLLVWSGRASAPSTEEIPPGFAGRVLDAPRPSPPDGVLRLGLHTVGWPSVCVSAAVILGGVVLLLSQGRLPEPAAGLPSGLGFLASQLLP